MLVRFGSDLVAAVLLCGWNGEDTSSRMLSAVSVGLHYLIGVRNYSWYTANNIVTVSVFGALSIGIGLVVAVWLCMKRGCLICLIL